jgi:hypothetical protein
MGSILWIFISKHGGWITNSKQALLPHKHQTSISFFQASISSDNHLRFYICFDSSSLTDWSLTFDVDLSSMPVLSQISPSQPSAVDVSMEGPVPSPFLSQKSTKSSKGTNFTSSTGSGGKSTKSDENIIGVVESDSGWSLSWIKEGWWGDRVAVSSGREGVIRVSIHFSSLCAYHILYFGSYFIYPIRFPDIRETF